LSGANEALAYFVVVSEKGGKRLITWTQERRPDRSQNPKTFLSVIYECSL